MSTRGPWRCPRGDVSEVHLRGPLKFVSQMSILHVLHGWTISKSTRGHLFPAGMRVLSDAHNHIKRVRKSGISAQRPSRASECNWPSFDGSDDSSPKDMAARILAPWPLHP